MSFRKRGFQELVDDVLTELTGGTVKEPILFTTAADDVPRFLLADTPVERIASVTGILGNDFRRFSDGDFALSADRTALEWRGENRPDEGSSFWVNYYPAAASSPITDRNVGSVARTLAEAVSRELAVLYEQLDLVYRSGFLDLAESTALDFVVALLGLERFRAGRQIGEVVFARSTPAPGDITLPAGTTVATPPQGEEQETFAFETLATRTLRQGQTEITAPIRFQPTPEQQAAFVSGQVAAGAISLLPKPIVGIESITNPEATTRGGEDESDDELRQRAKKAMAQTGQSTVDALRAAVLRHGPGVSVVVDEIPRGVPGEVDLVIAGADDERQREAIFRSLLASKAAGVIVSEQHAEPVEVGLGLRLEIHDDVQLSSAEANGVAAAVQSAVADYVNGRKAGEAVTRNALVALSLADSRVRNVTLEKLTTRRPELVDDAVARLRDTAGQPTDLASFDRVHFGLLEKATSSAQKVAVTVEIGGAEVTTAVRLSVTLVGAFTSAGAGTDLETIRSQIEILARGFVEAPERGTEVRLDELATFIQQATGLFQLEAYPASFLVAEHLATGVVDREVDSSSIGEKERAELAVLNLELD